MYKNEEQMQMPKEHEHVQIDEDQAKEIEENLFHGLNKLCWLSWTRYTITN